MIALGKVCWSQPLDDGENDIGIEFWWVGWQDPGAQEEIRCFLSERLGAERPAYPADQPASPS